MKPREWWIHDAKTVGPFTFPDNARLATTNPPVTEPLHGGEIIHVIEKSAYDSLAKDHEDDWKRIQDAERKCEELKSIIESMECAAAEIVHENERLTDINKQLQELPRIPSLENFERIKAENERLSSVNVQYKIAIDKASDIIKERDELKAIIDDMECSTAEIVHENERLKNQMVNEIQEATKWQDQERMKLAKERDELKAWAQRAASCLFQHCTDASEALYEEFEAKFNK